MTHRDHVRASVIRLSVAIGLSFGLASCADEPFRTTTAPPDPPPPPKRVVGVPDGWTGYTPTGYAIGVDSTNQRAGTAAVYLVSTLPIPFDHTNLTQTIRADDYRGRRVRWSGWVRPTTVGGRGGGLWMAVYGPGEISSFDDMVGTRSILGTAEWSEASVVLDVGEDAIGLAFGAVLDGPGDLVVDDLRLEIVGTDVPSTNELSEPSQFGDSASVAALFAGARSVPGNLDFEGSPGPAAATVAWLSETAVPFTTVQAGTNLTDLAPLEAMVGSARLVGMGEGTHGTKEFFQMKHRLFEFLVREMGFTLFAIEASWQEANDMNAYVLTGSGDPEQLLSGLYFWTWRTQEVLDLVQWMRQWNVSAPADQQVQFLGFDMQYPGAAMDTVGSYVRRVDSANVSFVEERYACLTPYRDTRGQWSQPWANYAGLPEGTRTACRTGLQQVFDLIDSKSGEYQSVTSPAQYANAHHSARVVQQWEDMVAGSTTYAGAAARDRYMAENAGWLLDQAGGGARMMLWAHNGHVSRVPGAMGWHLDSAFGTDYVNLGFLFGRGRFNAVEMSGGQTTGKGVLSFNAQLVPNSSLEATFLATGLPRLLLDARRIPEGGDPAAPLRGPIPMRAIGCCYDPTLAATYFAAQFLPTNVDLLIYLESASASTLLPFVSSAANLAPDIHPRD
jgi:erythromycin esterase